MKKFLNMKWPAYTALGLLFGALLWAGPASAGMILKQKDDGSAAWERSDSVAASHGANNEYVVGRQVVTVFLESLSSAGTAFVVSPISGQVTAVYTTILGALSASASWTGEVVSFSTRNSTTDAIADSFTDVTITFSGSAAGDVDSSESLTHAIDQGEVLAIGNAGLTSTDADAIVTIIIDPI